MCPIVAPFEGLSTPSSNNGAFLSTITPIEVPAPVKARWVNAFYIHDSSPAIIDPGVDSPEALAALKAGIEQHGGSLAAVDRVILTHGHIDHSGLAGRFAEENGASVYVHKLDRVSVWGTDRSRFKEQTEAYRRFFTRCGAPSEVFRAAEEQLVDRYSTYLYPLTEESTLEHNDHITFDTLELLAVHAPGHSAGGLCFLDEASGALYAGDAVFPEMTCNPLTENSSGEDPCRRHDGDFMVGLDRLDGLNVSKVYPGHGRPFSEYAAWMRKLRRTHDERLTAVRELARQRSSTEGDAGITAFEAGKSLFPTYSGLDAFIALSAGKQYLDVLCRQNYVQMIQSDPIRRFRWSGE